MMAATEQAAVSWAAREGAAVAPEDRARADVYALLAALFYGPPPEELLRVIREVEPVDGTVPGAPLAAAWHALKDAARGADAQVLRQEYDDAFVSVGRPPVFLHGSYYISGALMETPLVELREDLARLGVARRESSCETEDHITALCEVMRFLIVGDGAGAPAGIAAQREFFTRHIAPWYRALCDAIARAGETDFYKKVAAFTREFLDLEAESFSY
jgi:TorA maturation chaperone TorD